MSYCRWSSDDWQCDVYVYEDCDGGWTTHVAVRRQLNVLRNPYPFQPGSFNRWLVMHRVQMDLMKEEPADWLDLAAIGPEAGESYNDRTPGECADRLEALKVKGFNVPQYAIDTLREEQAESVQSVKIEDAEYEDRKD